MGWGNHTGLLRDCDGNGTDRSNKKTTTVFGIILVKCVLVLPDHSKCLNSASPLNNVQCSLQKKKKYLNDHCCSSLFFVPVRWASKYSSQLLRSSSCAQSRAHWAYADISKTEKYIEMHRNTSRTKRHFFVVPFVCRGLGLPKSSLAFFT